MKKHLFLALFVVAALIVAACGGEEPSGPPEVLEATFAHGLSEQMEAVDPGNEFEPDETVYLSVKLKGTPKEGLVSTRFLFGDQEITEASLDLAQLQEGEGLVFSIGGNTFVGFTLTHEQPFPAGDEYQAKLYINGAPAGTYDFEVSGPAAAAVEPTKSPESTPTQPPEPVDSGAVSSLEGVKSATIQIEAAGSFVHPEFGQVQNAGAGSGFIIDPSGIAVTNNHVVTGAGLLRVLVGGEDEPRNAKVLGVSECSDLAVIDIEGDGYPYLPWFDGDITTGLSIYAAGFPLGDPEYTLLQGIVSKERAAGETNWASVDSVIEHTALTNPGNSGGPVVTEDGKVVAVHYAGNADTEQHFAIARDEALPIIEQLRAGNDMNAIGLNGEAVSNGEGISGIWVASVESGSPADKAGIKGGDIITKLEGLVLAADGTKSDYCDILRTHNAGDALNIEVLRFSTEEVLEGQLNGPALQQKFSFAQQVESSGAAETGQSTSYSNYAQIADDTGALVMEIPAEWRDTNGSPWEIDGEVVGAAISAAGNLEDFYGTWSEPGVFFGASGVIGLGMTLGELLDSDAPNYAEDCEYQGRNDYEDPAYSGVYDVFGNCGGVGTTYVSLVAVPQDASFLIVLQMQATSQADLEALDRILNTFQVVGTLPGQ